MEYLQYLERLLDSESYEDSFKPYYKWNTFNTSKKDSKELKKYIKF